MRRISGTSAKEGDWTGIGASEDIWEKLDRFGVAEQRRLAEESDDEKG